MELHIGVHYYIGKKRATHSFHPVYNDRCFPFAVALYVHSGSYLVWQAGTWRRYKPGEAFLIKPFVFHMVKIDELSVISWAHLSWRTPGGMDVLSCVEIPSVFSGEFADQIRRFCENMAEASEEGGEKPLTSAVLLQKEALSLLALLFQHPDTVCRGMTESTTFREKVSAYISERVNGDISVSQMAGAFHLSPSAFRRKFIRLLNTTPKKFIQERRLELALEYLACDNMTVAEVAAKTGYNDPSYFSHAFTQVYRISPSQYRNRVINSLKNG